MAECGDPDVNLKDDIVDEAREKWVKIVVSTIPKPWLDFLSNKTLQEDDATIYDILEETLRKVHDKHFNPEGWYISPRGIKILSWMTCPPTQVRAIILLMEPMPTSHHYASTGYALGVQKRSGHQDMTIDKFPTLQKLFKILMALMDNNEFNMSKYNNGFDPTYLSRKGILFLNNMLTKGERGLKDIEWTGFFEALLGAIEKSKEVENIRIVQFYNNYMIQKFLERKGIAEKFSVYRPSFMDDDKDWENSTCNDYNVHLAHFSEPNNIDTFVNGLKEQKEFGDIMREIAEEVLFGENCVVQHTLDQN